MYCTRCGTENNGDSRFCKNCGAVLSGARHFYCRNCGKEVREEAAICLACGVPAGKGTRFCRYCGAATGEAAGICVKCGARLEPAGTGEKEWLIALLLCVFLGYLGIHRFYTGHIGIGIIQLLTGGGCGIWTLIDLIMIVTGSYKDKSGNHLVRR